MNRLLGLDVGDARIGLAVGEASLGLAVPLRTLRRSANAEDDARSIADIARDEGVEALVVGLPLRESGEEGAQASRVRAFAESLARVAGLPIHWQDERYTSVEARERLGPAGPSPKRRRRQREQEVDALAAAIILQTFLNASDRPD